IRMNSGIGVSEKLVTLAALLRTSWASPGSPPRKRIAPIRLMAMNENATGMPMKSSTVDPPSSSSAAICQDMLVPRRSGRRDRVFARLLAAAREAVHAEDELDGEQHERDRHRQQHPPLGHDQRLDRHRPVGEAVGRDTDAVAHEEQAAHEA